jgi:ABC-type branched-subunit amino acid transport system ATPase component
MTVIRDVTLEVRPGEVVGLLGPNGAGKTTLLLTLAGELPPQAGEVLWRGKTAKLPLYRRSRQGLGLVTEGRSLCTTLTVRQNLRIAAGCDVEKARALFPELVPLMRRRAGLLSGGEQQMLALARALARPISLLLADELSLGLAPQLVTRLLRAVRAAADRGMGALIVEQHASRVLEVADRVYVLRRGRMVFSGTGAETRERLSEIQALYLSHEIDETLPSRRSLDGNSFPPDEESQLN